MGGRCIKRRGEKGVVRREGSERGYKREGLEVGKGRGTDSQDRRRENTAMRCYQQRVWGRQ